ncbi:MAG: hypothetical protein FIA97_07660 [Methylococcaceae bacterium]|nr:hypothetical protein [Methylococcaceae bacterium]
MSSPIKTLFTRGHFAKSAGRAAAGLAILISPWTAHAASVQATANAAGYEARLSNTGSTPTQISQIDERSTPGNVNAAASGLGFAASASASADFGLLKASVSGSGSAPDEFHFSGAGQPSASAAFADTLTVTTPSVAAGQGFLHARLDISSQFECSGTTCGVNSDLHVGSAEFSPANFARVLQFQSGPTLNLNVIVTGVNSSPVASGPGVGNGVLDLTIPFFFGSPFDLRLALNISAFGAGNTGSGSGFGSVSNAVSWAGITGVTDVAGNPISFTVSSASGTNYLGSLAPTAVPLPPALWLLASAVAGMGLIGRRRTTADA